MITRQLQVERGAGKVRRFYHCATQPSDDDINREVRNMFMRTNVLMRRLGNCSISMKWILFKCYCLCMYDAGLWHCYLKGSIQKLRSCYNRCLKMFLVQPQLQSDTNLAWTWFPKLSFKSAIGLGAFWSCFSPYDTLAIYWHPQEI